MINCAQLRLLTCSDSIAQRVADCRYYRGGKLSRGTFVDGTRHFDDPHLPTPAYWLPTVAEVVLAPLEIVVVGLERDILRHQIGKPESRGAVRTNAIASLAIRTGTH